MVKFRLPRKIKKRAYNNGLFRVHYNQVSYNWYKDKEKVSILAMRVILEYPSIATKEQMLKWYSKHYPNNKRAQQICEQI